MMNRERNHNYFICLSRAIFCLALFLQAGPLAAQAFFTNVTEPALLNLHLYISPSSINIQRIAIGDYDNDGWPDLLGTENFFSSDGKILLLHNEMDGHFANHATAIQAGAAPQVLSGGFFADYDNDGDLDLYIGVGGIYPEAFGPDRLLRNDRGAFADVTQAAGLTDSSSSENVIWLDYDRDGHLDIYVGNFAFGDSTHLLRNRLYRNNGDHTFADVTREAGLDVQLTEEGGGSGQGMVAADFDDDGWPDLYLSVFRQSNRLFLNDGQGSFTDATTSEIADIGGESFGVAVGDIDNDGRLDIFQASGAGNTEGQRALMFSNLGDGLFLDVTEGVGLGGIGNEDGNSRGAGLADIDNDGDLDLLIAFPFTLFLNNGDGTFVDQTSRAVLGNPPSGNGAIVFGDLNLDGFLDIWLDRAGPNPLGTLLRNNGMPQAANHWLRVELVGTASNRNGIGARLIATAGELRQVREIVGGMGYYQDEMVAHFGLGAG